jgi:GNAT superfamily N-acetyltransferase
VTTIELRDATIHDAEGIADMHVKTWQDAYRGVVPDDHLDGLDVVDRAKRWREGISAPEGPIRVAEVDDRIVGWACYGTTRDSDADDRTTGELYGIYVRSECWGSGVGPALMDEALAWLAERYAVATLWTLEANARARAFYERTGWRFDGTTKDDDRQAFVLREVRYRIDF